MKGSGACEALLWRGADRSVRRRGDTNASTYGWTATNGTRAAPSMWTTWSSPAGDQLVGLRAPDPEHRRRLGNLQQQPLALLDISSATHALSTCVVATRSRRLSPRRPDFFDVDHVHEPLKRHDLPCPQSGRGCQKGDARPAGVDTIEHGFGCPREGSMSESVYQSKVERLRKDIAPTSSASVRSIAISPETARRIRRYRRGRQRG